MHRGANQMLALVVRGPREHRLELLARPTPRNSEALVSVTHVAMCGTDLRLLRGTLHDAEYPVIPGHEWAGEVAAAPSRPELVGRVVVGHNFVPCGICESCRRGSANLCPSLDELGFTLPGAFAEQFCVPTENLRLLPSGLTPAEGCLLEPLCVAVHAIQRAPDLYGRNVGVIGGGTIGLLVAQVAASAGAGNVSVVDPIAQRRAIADELGLRTAVSLRVWEDARPEIVFDATGVAAVFADGLRAVKPGGAYVLVGYSGEELTPFAPSTVMLRELTVIGVLSGYGQLDRALELAATGSVRLAPLLSEPLPMINYLAVLRECDGPPPLRRVFTLPGKTDPAIQESA